MPPPDATRNEHTETTPKPTPTARKPLGRRWWFRILRFFVFFYAAWCGTLYFYQDKLLFPADLAGSPLPLKYSATTVELERNVNDGNRQFKVVAWFVPAVEAGPDRPCPLVVYFHGNAELIDAQHHMINFYHRHGCHVLLPEYRGYGRSGGKPSEAGILDDAAYFLAEALRRPDVDPARVLYHGRSLGGGPCAGLADRRAPRAMILESTFTSAASMARKYWAPEFLATNPFHVDRVVARLDIPLLLFHGTTDDIIPVEHGRALRDLARHGRYIEYACRHNDFPGPGEDDYWRQIETFLTETGLTPSDPTAATRPTPRATPPIAPPTQPQTPPKP